MLVSNGYTSLAELWTQFAEFRREEVYRYACERYKSPEFAGYAIAGVSDEFGSPKDLLEEVFIKSLEDFRLTVCAPSGATMMLPTCVSDGSSHIFQRLTVFESTGASEELSDRGLNEDSLYRMGSSEFAAWPHKLCAAREWSDAFPISKVEDNLPRRWARCRFNRLPMWFERHRFVVTSSPPPWTSDALDTAFASSTVPLIFGQSICLEDRLASRWTSENIKSHDYRRFLGQDQSETKFTGRPSKQERALELMNKLYSDGRRPPWKVVCATLSERCDFDVSVRTVQRAGQGTKFSRK